MPIPFEREVDLQRRRLLRLERAASTDLLRSYLVAHRRLRARLEDLTERIAAARADGEILSAGWLERERRYQSLLIALEHETRAFARRADTEVTRTQADAADLAAERAGRLASVAAGPAPQAARAELEDGFRRLPRAALERIVGNASDGKPLGRLLAELAPGAVRKVRDELAFGVAAGRPIREIAQGFRDATGQATIDRALTICRTEVLRAYRETSIETYAANPQVVTGWVWTADLSNRTCAACWAMHGTFHTVDEALDGHPGCRCTPTPRTRSWAEMGFHVTDRRPTVEPGVEAFRRLPEPEKLAVLGRAKLDAYNNGQVTLDDLVVRTRHPRWGTMRREASLRELQRR